MANIFEQWLRHIQWMVEGNGVEMAMGQGGFGFRNIQILPAWYLWYPILVPTHDGFYGIISNLSVKVTDRVRFDIGFFSMF